MTFAKKLSLKKALKDYCLKTVSEKIKIAHDTIESINESVKQETKSSAGDKHETSRALMQNEMDKAKMNLAKALELEYELSKIDENKEMNSVQPGSVVKTNSGNFFISIALGKIDLNGDSFFAISLGSPIGQALKEKRPGEMVNFQNKEIKILEIY